MKARFCPHCAAELIQAHVDGRERLKCPFAACGYVHWDNPVPIVAAIVELDGEVVLARSKGWPADKYALVAGFLERDETVDTAVLREVREELGLVGEIVSFVGYYSFLERNQLILVFHVRVEGEIILGEELEAAKRVPLDELRPWSRGTGPALRDWLVRREQEVTVVDGAVNKPVEVRSERCTKPK
jgi:NAD+ diphosphatase